MIIICLLRKIIVLISVLFIMSCLLFFPHMGFSADYFVSPNGNDSWQGNVESGGFLPEGCDADGDTSDCTNGPWKTIQHALDKTGAGDIITVKKGVYSENILFHNSGSSESPRILQGETDVFGNLLTTIDPGVMVNGWVLAPEVGTGVFKVSESQFGYTPSIITVQGKRVGVLHSEIMATDEGFGILATNTSETVTPESTGITINYWDGIEALAGSKDGTFYIRFRNGDDPNDKIIKVYRNISTLGISDQNYNNIKNLNIVCANIGVAFDENSHNNILENCKLTCGRYRVGLYDGAYENIIRNNFMSMNYYGYDDLGPWIQGKELKHGTREHIYRIFKYKIGSSTSDSTALQMLGAGNANEIYNNTIKQDQLGITLTGTQENVANGTKIHDNFISGIDSVGMTCSPGVTETYIYSNEMDNCAISFRIHKMNDPETGVATYYIYRNKSWLPRGVGRHIFIHWLSDGNNAKANIFWICNNSFSGGYYGLYNARYSEDQLLSKVYLFNNIITSTVAFYCQSASAFAANKLALGAFDYNLLGISGQQQEAVWFGGNNVVETEYFWLENDKSFSVKDRYDVLDKGLDLSKPFTDGGISYNPPSVFWGEKFSGLAPDLGAEEDQLQNNLLPPTKLNIK